MKQYVELKVVGHPEELKEFLSLVQLIQSFGDFGMSREIKVTVDGDGSGRLGFYMKDDTGEYKDLPSFKLDDLHKMEEAKVKYTVYIGE